MNHLSSTSEITKHVTDVLSGSYVLSGTYKLYLEHYLQNISAKKNEQDAYNDLATLLHARGFNDVALEIEQRIDANAHALDGGDSRCDQSGCTTIEPSDDSARDDDDVRRISLPKDQHVYESVGEHVRPSGIQRPAPFASSRSSQQQQQQYRYINHGDTPLMEELQKRIDTIETSIFDQIDRYRESEKLIDERLETVVDNITRLISDHRQIENRLTHLEDGQVNTGAKVTSNDDALRKIVEKSEDDIINLQQEHVRCDKQITNILNDIEVLYDRLDVLFRDRSDPDKSVSDACHKTTPSDRHGDRPPSNQQQQPGHQSQQQSPQQENSGAPNMAAMYKKISTQIKKMSDDLNIRLSTNENNIEQRITSYINNIERKHQGHRDWINGEISQMMTKVTSLERDMQEEMKVNRQFWATVSDATKANIKELRNRIKNQEKATDYIKQVLARDTHSRSGMDPDDTTTHIDAKNLHIIIDVINSLSDFTKITKDCMKRYNIDLYIIHTNIRQHKANIRQHNTMLQTLRENVSNVQYDIRCIKYRNSITSSMSYHALQIVMIAVVISCVNYFSLYIYNILSGIM